MAEFDPNASRIGGYTKDVVIPNGGSLSEEVDLEGAMLAAIVMPASPDWTAADLTLQAAPASEGTFQNVYDDDGVEVKIAAAADRVIVVTSAMVALATLRYLKFRSGTAAAPVNQGAARTITLILKRG